MVLRQSFVLRCKVGIHHERENVTYLRPPAAFTTRGLRRSPASARRYLLAPAVGFEDHDMVIVAAASSQAAFAIARKFSVSTYAACATATALATLAFAAPTIAPACAAT